MITHENFMDKNTSEIVKLTERISKDPRSKLFVPLAEEYKKIGEVEMAIHVLSEGLKNNPGYVTARSLLGRLLFEKGELIAAQKEFEEVVKVIPDNLLAQKKLGDLYALQHNQTEALNHYKRALALNPGDESLASLISVIQKGLEAQTRLPEKGGAPGESAVTSEHESVPHQEQEIAAVQPVQPAVTRLSATTGEQERAPLADFGPATVTKLEPPEQAGAKEQDVSGLAVEEKTVTPEVPAKLKHEIAEPLKDAGFGGVVEEPQEVTISEAPEEPEEVLVLESLEDEHLLEKPMLPDVDFLAENAKIGGLAVESAGQAGVLEKAKPPIEPELLREPEQVPLSAAPPESEPDLLTELPAAPFEPEPARAKTPEFSDDFTTDTLAELYIAQGFYEKAIDIYQRMLADRPDSAGLKDKLDGVRAMAASAEASMAESPNKEQAGAGEAAGDIFAEAKEYVPSSIKAGTPEIVSAAERTPEADIFADAREYVPPAASEAEENLTIDAELLVEAEPDERGAKTNITKEEKDIFTELREYTTPPAQPEEQSQMQEAMPDVFTATPPAEHARTQPAYVDFEPREYIPPDAPPRMTTAQKGATTQKSSATARKETIDRLEHWLQNIKKEK